MEKIFKCGHSVKNLKEKTRYTISNKNSTSFIQGPNADEHYICVYCSSCNKNYDVLVQFSKFNNNDGKFNDLSNIL